MPNFTLNATRKKAVGVTSHLVRAKRQHETGHRDTAAVTAKMLNKVKDKSRELIFVLAFVCGSFLIQFVSIVSCLTI